MTKVLVVDDNDTLHELFRCYAMMGNVELSHAVNLDEALAHIGAAAPDLVLLDNRLQPYDSYRQTVPILRDAGFEGKLVVISSEIQEPIFSEYKKHTVDAVFNKFDFTLENFSKTISSLV